MNKMDTTLEEMLEVGFDLGPRERMSSSWA